MNTHILIVEDETDLAQLMADYVRNAQLTAHVLGDGLAALAYLSDTMPSLIVLDLMLPGLDGLSLCQQIRQRSQVPIIIVTAKVEEVDRLIGLESGADDYLCKPFSPRELVARIKTVLRRSQTWTAKEKCLPSFEIKAEAQCIYLQGQALDLTRSEFFILCSLLQHSGKILSRQQLLDNLNQDHLDVTDRAIDSHIKNLRKKISAILADYKPITSIYGFGYRFDC